MTAAPTPGPSPARRVILIDDDAAVLASLEAMFAARDYAVRAFDSAAAFLADLPDLPPACIVTDLHMPGMDGAALLKRLKGETGLSWPVILISGQAGRFDAAAAKRAGAADFLAKPFAPEQLLARVNRALADDGREGDAPPQDER